MPAATEEPFTKFPFIIGWELTLRCNLRCQHCASSAGASRLQELTQEEALNLCDQFPDLLVQEVDFTGGEPLISELWPAVFARLQKLEITTKVLTNGLTLSGELVRQLHGLGVAGIGISLDGLAPTHDAIRGAEGLFERIFRNIEHVQKLDIPLTIITTITRANLPELPDLLAHLIGQGITSWQMQPLFPLGRAVENDALQLSDEEYLGFGDFVVEWKDHAQLHGLEMMLADSYGYYTHRDRRDPPWRGCPAGLYSCGITSDGRVKGCLSMPNELIEGDLRERDLWEIWFDPGSFAYTRRFTPADLGDNCRECPFAEECLGGCSAMSYGCTGSFHNNPYCFTRIEKVRRGLATQTA
jgi:radical SAM protein with 4Fe4S-binding SPASM domain